MDAGSRVILLCIVMAAILGIVIRASFFHLKI